MADDRIEAAAKAIYEVDYASPQYYKWDKTPESVKESHRAKARAAAAVLSGPDETLRVAAQNVLDRLRDNYPITQANLDTLEAAISHPAAPRMDPTIQDEVRDTRQDATAKAQSARNAGCICSRKMPYLDWSHDKDCPLYRPISVPAEASSPLPEADVVADVVDEMLDVFDTFFTEPVIHTRDGDIKRMTAALAVARKGWVPLSEVDKFLLSDLSDDFGPEVVERLHKVMTAAERTERKFWTR